jgi:hypothetical protein
LDFREAALGTLNKATKVVLPFHPHPGEGDHQRLLVYILKDCEREGDMFPYVAELTDEELVTVLMKSGIATAIAAMSKRADGIEVKAVEISQSSTPVQEEPSVKAEIPAEVKPEESKPLEASTPGGTSNAVHVPMETPRLDIGPVTVKSSIPPHVAPVEAPRAPAPAATVKPPVGAPGPQSGGARTSFDEELDQLFGASR